ncbi:NUDIX domain-containing protein [bacterium]|nr:NUDIX domain-containing protein [bacterium]
MSALGRKQSVEQTFGTKAHKLGAVLILLFPLENKACFPLTQRHQYKGVHSGQVSLPGGKYEAQDRNLMATALRETEEEIGVEPSKIEVIGALSTLYIPPSNFLVHPYIGFTKEKPHMKKDDFEVHELFETDLETLLHPQTVQHTRVKIAEGLRINTPYFNLNNKIVWGATAMILSELKEILNQI